MHTYNVNLERLACWSFPSPMPREFILKGLFLLLNPTQQLLLFYHAASVQCLTLYCVILPAFYLSRHPVWAGCLWPSCLVIIISFVFLFLPSKSLHHLGKRIMGLTTKVLDSLGKDEGRWLSEG